MGIGIATKAFFKLLFNRELGRQFQQLLEGQLPARLESIPASPTLKKTSAAEKPLEKQQPTVPVRSEAIELLAALQRESRLLDIVTEPLESYSDAQVGAAARDVLKNTRLVIERMFGIEPLTDVEDGQAMTTPAEFDPAHFRLTGNVQGQAPFSGAVAHHGWKATRCEIPQWSGKAGSKDIIAPIELEL